MRLHTSSTTAEAGDSTRWWMLGLGSLASTSAALTAYGPAFLIPALRKDYGLSLGQAGVIVAMPIMGLTVTLLLWGALVDRMGERRVLVWGSALVCAATVVAALVARSPVALAAGLVVAGVGSASGNAAGGRMVIGWFPVHQRGIAMGIRQGSQPLGVAFGALVLPRVAEHYGIGPALAIPAALAGIAALGCWIGVIDPPRPATAQASSLTDNPYRGDSTLWRLLGGAILSVIPQSVIWSFAFVWLRGQHGWSPGAAGALIALTTAVGAASRVASGAWSDRVGSRIKPLRVISTASALMMATLALTDQLHMGIAVFVMVLAAIMTVAPQGLPFSVVAEVAGPYWCGRGMGIQNTGTNLAQSLVPPLIGALIATAGYPAVFLLTAAMAVAAVFVYPSDDYLSATAPPASQVAHPTHLPHSRRVIAPRLR